MWQTNANIDTHSVFPNTNVFVKKKKFSYYTVIYTNTIACSICIFYSIIIIQNNWIRQHYDRYIGFSRILFHYHKKNMQQNYFSFDLRLNLLVSMQLNFQFHIIIHL